MNDEHNCIWCNETLSDYVSGNLSEEDNQKVKRHLNDCKSCRTLFENRENDSLMGSDINTINFKKLKTMFVGKVVSIVAISMISLFLLGFVIMPLLYSVVFSNRNQTASRVFADTIMFTVPSARIESFSSNQDFSNLKLSCKYSQGPFGAVNEIDLTIPNIFGKTNTSGDGYSSPIFFNDDAISGDLQQNKIKWDKLEKIGDISVCQAVIYFSSPLPLQEVDSFLASIKPNYNYTWIAVDTGDIKLYPKMSSNWSWGFPRKIQTVTEAKAGLNDGALLTAAQEFKTEMQFLEKEGKYLGNKNLSTEIKDINSYINNNGIKAKGVVVVAPTTDLLNVKDSKIVSNIDIKKAELDYNIDF